MKLIQFQLTESDRSSNNCSIAIDCA